MALVNCGYLVTPSPLGTTTVGTAMLLDANTEMAWALHQIQRSGGGTLTRVHFRTATVTTGATVDVRLETVSGTGFPTGTLFGTNTNIAQVIADANDNVLFRTDALTGSATVAMGDILAVVLQVPAGANLNISRSPVQVGNRGFPYAGTPDNATKVDLTGSPFALEYSDGAIELPAEVLPGCCTPASFTISTSSNPDEIGLHFTAPYAGRVIGWWLYAGLPTGTTYRIALYAVGNNTPLATSPAMDSDYTTSAGARLYMGALTTAATLTAGTAYRVSVVPLTTSNLTLYRMTAYNSAWFESLGLPTAQETSRNRSGTTDPDSAAWSEPSTTGDYRRIEMGLIFDQLDNGAGSGGGNKGDGTGMYRHMMHRG